MEKMARVALKNGNWKYFYGENAEKEANAYEVEVKQHEIEEKERQKREQEERAKAVAKAEEERKKKAEVKEYRYNQVLDKVESLNKVVEAYEKDTGEKIYYINEDGKLKAKTYRVITNGLVKDFFDLWN